MSRSHPIRIRGLTVSDLHQSQVHYEALARAVNQHQPDVVALVGDVLNVVGSFGRTELSTKNCAQMLAQLPVEHLIFVRGNHEDDNWPQFVAAWPHVRRPLTALYGSACAIGPLVIVGFPCLTGSEFQWCAHLSATDNRMEEFPIAARPELPSDFEIWLPDLMRKTGSAGRVLWLMHEPPVGLPLADPRLFNPIWTSAIERFSPLLVASGHDHTTPLQNSTWHTRFGKTVCLNVGQTAEKFHYALLDFEFAETSPSIPSRITIRSFPWNQTVAFCPTHEE